MECSKCKSEKIIPNVDLVENRRYLLKARVASDPEAFVFKGEEYGVLMGFLCCSCGFVDLYCSTASLDLLWDTYQESNDKDSTILKR